ncbi:hypothetical protein QR98_0051540 [Sarcoptes scabiei]|uniref:MTP large subunit lipid-binding domain-containing protein n=1 Tax=Sarcoptes scabiei TaxID=52283 RepID=A0A132A6S7_SARSC|nr:hypothetical protein QR98_0051540 [Sarcoptes scabiei]
MFPSFFLIVIIFILKLTNQIDSHPAPACHGLLIGTQYSYSYRSSLILNNDDNLEPAGFKLEGQVTIKNIWQNNEAYLAAIDLKQFRFHPRESMRKRFVSDGPVINHWPIVLAHIEIGNGEVKNLFIQNNEMDSKIHIESTHLNLVIAILNALRNKKGTKLVWYDWEQNNQILVRKYRSQDRINSSRSSLLSPLYEEEWIMESKLASDHDITEMVSGWQNITFGSKIYPKAHSKLFANFDLKLIDQKHDVSTSLRITKAESISEAVNLFGEYLGNKKMINLGPGHFRSEKKCCKPHFCGEIDEFVHNYREALSEDKALATNSMSLAHLRLLTYIHVNQAQLKRQQIASLLNKYAQTRLTDGNILSILLDVIATSRHPESMLAALDFLNLPKCRSEERVKDCERFLMVIAVSGSAVANMGSSFAATHSLSLNQLINLFIPLVSNHNNNDEWADERVYHSFLMTIASLLHSYRVYIKSIENQNHPNITVNLAYSEHHNKNFLDHISTEDSVQSLIEGFIQSNSDSINLLKHNQKFSSFAEKVIKHLQNGLDRCKNTECRIVYLGALGNLRILSKHGVFNTLKNYSLNSGKRESVAAMKAIRDCVQFEAENDRLLDNEKLSTRLRRFLLRIVYDSEIETTSRLIGAELLANHIDRDGNLTIELVQHLDRFPSELATMIWKRAVIKVLSKHRKRSENWHLHSKILSGSSASFRYVMAQSQFANASYGVFLELLKGKLPKETSFNFDISQNDLYQDIITVGLFARGLQSFAGQDSSEQDSNDLDREQEEEPTLAGMTLKVMDQQLRPFLFFSSTSELMGHVWSGSASEPTPVFRANLLLADYFDIKPLINGFLVEQSLKGIFSLNLKGEIQISLWNRNSHSNVQTSGAVLFQGSQEIFFTSDLQTSARKLFSFGGESKLDFITDFDFYSSPFRICIQITQPEFIFRHNTRKYEQLYSKDLHRRIHRRSYKIPAKSYILNRDNSEMCALMNEPETGLEHPNLDIF